MSESIKPTPSPEILYWLGAGVGLHEQMEWYRSEPGGVFRQRDNARMTAEQIDLIQWFDGHPRAKWQERGVDPCAHAHTRSLDAHMVRYGFITARDWVIHRYSKYPLASAYDGRGVYFLIEVPKVRFTGRCRIRRGKDNITCELTLTFGAGDGKPWLRLGPWAWHRHTFVKVEVDFPASPPPHRLVFADDFTLFRLESDTTPEITHTISASTVALRSGLLQLGAWRVLYVGISNGIKGRWARHPKIAQALAFCPNDSEIALLAMHFEESVLWQSEVLPWFKQVTNAQPREIQDRHRLLAIEAALIWHFQPPLNTEGKAKPGWQQKQLQAALLKAGLTELKVAIANDDSQPFRFFSDTVKPAEEIRLIYRIASSTRLPEP